MNLRSPYPYWLLRHGIINSYPSLQNNITADVAIIGAGISGALLAWQLNNSGLSTVVLDRRHAGMGSTAASTNLLQYEIDTPLYKLTAMVGKEYATKSYLLCRNAIDSLEAICKKIKEPGIFVKRPSFQYVSFLSHYGPLHAEYTLRKAAGFKLDWLEKDEIRRKFGFNSEGGLLSAHGAAADAYKLTHLLLKYVIKSGGQVFDNTEVTQINTSKSGIQLKVSTGMKVKAKKLIIACGYESQQYIPFKVQKLHSTYAIASEPFSQTDFWYKNALIWETATPYLYLRTTDDNRVIVGGKDVPFTNPSGRDRLINSKAKALERAFSKLFPGIALKTDFKWTGNFASTKDGLPFIGSIRQMDHTYFALGYGGNGITFSMIASEIIRDLILGKTNKNVAIFSFDR
jgi:glycine/D-amino acid oxidase-like deaminating enzyme